MWLASGLLLLVLLGLGAGAPQRARLAVRGGTVAAAREVAWWDARCDRRRSRSSGSSSSGEYCLRGTRGCDLAARYLVITLLPCYARCDLAVRGAVLPALLGLARRCREI